MRLGLIGAGRAAFDLHLPALRRMPSIQVAAITDVDAGRARSLAGRLPGSSVQPDASVLFADPTLNAVAILTPPATHAALTLAALASGKHLFLEKPIALTLDDCHRILAEAQSNSAVKAVGTICDAIALSGRRAR